MRDRFVHIMIRLTVLSAFAFIITGEIFSVQASDRLEEFAGIVNEIGSEGESAAGQGAAEGDQQQKTQKSTQKNTQSTKKKQTKKTKSTAKTTSKPAKNPEKTVENTAKNIAKNPTTAKSSGVSIDDLHITAGATSRMERKVKVIEPEGEELTEGPIWTDEEELKGDDPDYADYADLDGYFTYGEDEEESVSEGDRLSDFARLVNETDRDRE